MSQFTVAVPVEDAETVVAVFPGFTTVTVVKQPDSFAVYVGETYHYSTKGEEDYHFAEAVLRATAEATRIFNEGI